VSLLPWLTVRLVELLMSRNGGSTAMQAPLPMSPTGRALVAAMVTASSGGAGASRVDRDGRTTPAASVDSDDDDDDMESQHPFIVLGTRTNTLAARTPSPPPVPVPAAIETAAARWQNRKAMVRKLWTTLVASSS